MRMSDELFLIDGNSLAYRAFFALPESIATSTGVPTNAIFGFASMLVKILTDYGPKATVVVWDAGSSGRKEVYSEYKAQRSSRPDLLKEQWPALEPLVEAFGYRNLQVDGYEADDVIASIAEQAKTQDPPIEVMVVTGDRDAYQLVDEQRADHDHLARDHRHPRLRPRGGDRPLRDPARAGPRLHRPQGRHQRQHPRGSRASATRPPPSCCSGSARSEHVLDSIDEISGAKRKQNLTEHADDARMSKQLATAKRDIQLGLDIRRATCPRRLTARGCATCFASSSCASRCAGSRRRSDRPTPPPRLRPPSSRSRRGCARARSRSSGRCRDRPSCRSPCARLRRRRGRCSAMTPSGASASTAPTPTEVLVGTCAAARGAGRARSARGR